MTQQSAHSGDDKTQAQDQEVYHTDNTVTTGNVESQSQATTTSNLTHRAWIFQAYLRQVDVIALRVGKVISNWRKHKSVDSDDRILSELYTLHSDMISQMSNKEESWEDTIYSKEWLQDYDEKEKKLLARAMQNFRSNPI